MVDARSTKKDDKISLDRSFYQVIQAMYVRSLKGMAAVVLAGNLHGNKKIIEKQLPEELVTYIAIIAAVTGSFNVVDPSYPDKIACKIKKSNRTWIWRHTRAGMQWSNFIDSFYRARDAIYVIKKRPKCGWHLCLKLIIFSGKNEPKYYPIEGMYPKIPDDTLSFNFTLMKFEDRREKWRSRREIMYWEGEYP